MPIPAAVAAAGITAGAGLIGQGFNAYSQGKINKKSRKWNEKMYAWQRQDALQDWAMQNAYNSPAAQMQRFKDAGLNPNLIYGQQNEGATVRSTDMKSWSPDAPRLDLGGIASNAFGAYWDAQVKEATVNNLEAQNTVQQQEALLKAAQILETTSRTNRNKFDLGLSEELRQTSIDAARSNVVKLQADTQYTLDNNERAAAMNSSNLKEAMERILTMKAQRLNTAAERQRIYATIENIKKDSTLKQLDINMKKMGIQPNDPAYMRILSRLIGNVSPEEAQKINSTINPFSKGFAENVKKGWNRLFD